MISLVVLLPPSTLLGPQGWGAVPLAYARVGDAGQVLDRGHALAEALPRSDKTVVILSSCDTLLLKAPLPPVTGMRLQRALPNAVEEQLIQDPQRCHVSVDPDPAPDGGRYLAVVDREWFASVVAVFAREGRGRLKVVPLMRCVPLPREARQPDGEPALHLVELAVGEDAQEASPAPAEDALADAATTDAAGQPASALIVRHGIVATLEGEASASVEVAVRHGGLGLGLEVDERRLSATLAFMTQQAPTDLYELEPVAGDSGSADHVIGFAAPEAVSAFAFGALANAALACRLDLCQFEFSRSGRGTPGTKRWWRWAAGLSAAAALCAITALNVHWFQLRHQRDALNAQMVAVLKASFPDIPVVMDPQAQMTSRLKALAAAGGALRADDFAVEVAALSRALPPLPSASIAALDYSSGSLAVTFRPGTSIDAEAFRNRLASNGLLAKEEEGKWRLVSATSRPR
jgi:general secretion pathway protein L